MEPSWLLERERVDGVGRVGQLNHELVEARPSQPTKVGQQPRDPEPVVPHREGVGPASQCGDYAGREVPGKEFIE